MKKTISYIFAIITITYSNVLFAAWYEVTGSATILSSEDTARIHALEDATYQAMMFSGSDISTLNALRPYLQEKRNEYQFSNSEVRNVRVIEEKKRGGKVYLKTRIDIYPSANSCHSLQYKKSILVGNIDIISPQQAVMGSVYHLGEDFSVLLKRQIEQQSQSFFATGISKVRITPDQPQIMKMISEDTGAHYIVGGQISDLTATIEINKLRKDQINRQFALSIFLIDGKTGETIYQNNYRDIAEWPFAKTSQVDTKSARFWTSTYGAMLQRVNRDILLDLETELTCKATLPQVVDIRNNKVQIDLGREHGVKRGDTLQLWHTGSFIDQYGLPRNKVTQSEITLTVDRVYEKGAELIVNQPKLANSIQIGDVMSKPFK